MVVQNRCMHGCDFIDDVEQRLVDGINRGRDAGHSVTPDQLNWCPGPSKWSMAQIFEHMMLANAGYLPTIRNAIDSSAKDQQRQVKHTFFGKLIIRGAGPQGNAPAPKQLVPGPGPYTPDIIDRWAAQSQAVLDMAREARAIDLCDQRVPNPFFSFLKMNLADCFMIIAEHTERHVQQIEGLEARCRQEFPSHASTRR